MLWRFDWRYRVAEEEGVVAGRCAACGYEFDDAAKAAAEPADTPCPSCGAIGRRHFFVGTSDFVQAHEFVVVKGEQQGKRWGRRRRKHYREVEAGEQLQRGYVAGDGRPTFVDKYRLIDREHDQYVEIVNDPETGVVRREVRHSLRDHTGHGSGRVDPP